jgi:hypothetical protein
MMMAQARGKGHPVDRRERFEDGQPSREIAYDVKEEVSQCVQLSGWPVLRAFAHGALHITAVRWVGVV